VYAESEEEGKRKTNTDGFERSERLRNSPHTSENDELVCMRERAVEIGRIHEPTRRHRTKTVSRKILLHRFVCLFDERFFCAHLKRSFSQGDGFRSGLLEAIFPFAEQGGGYRPVSVIFAQSGGFVSTIVFLTSAQGDDFLHMATVSVSRSMCTKNRKSKKCMNLTNTLLPPFASFFDKRANAIKKQLVSNSSRGCALLK